MSGLRGAARSRRRPVRLRYDNAARTGLIEVELTLLEALCAWWRIWWPPHALLLAALVVLAQLTRYSDRHWLIVVRLSVILPLPQLFLLAEVLFIGGSRRGRTPASRS